MKKVKSFFAKLLLMTAIISICLNGLGMFAKVHADTAAFQMDARAAYAIDAESGQVLYQKDATKRYPIASVIKILTLGVILQDIRNHHLKWDQKIKITPAVAKMADDWHFSNVPLMNGEEYTVRQLVDSMMLVSADGSTEALALADAGSTAAFNKKMMAFAKKAGVTDIKIYNMIGLPNGDLGKHKLKGVDKDAENLLSAKDVALISKYLVENYPETLDITKQKFANFDVTKDQQYLMTNVNALLPQNGFAPKDGEIDGLKTGNTDRAGKCIVSTGTFAGRRIILVALHTKGEWNDQSKMQQDFYNKLIDGYQPVEIKKVNDLSAKLTSVKVKNGKNKNKANIKLTKKTTVWLPKNMKLQATKPTLRVQGDDQKQLTAPIKKNQQVGSIELHIPGLPDFNIPVSANRSVAEKSMF
ncbi:D-alanyl-D-alanine carboxypeptidase family protein [Limosilactobacillus reuteri]|uniref:D-alanyl-D-alanine carboxypeptidase family protein n=1 Tax=Limosilactobacillus reuteri TaxID=1598 RepID=UPI00081C184E|nr:serine hydrolase [Limosilactobacillus reuteri]MCH5379507.1 serine hydrolase [Limosilactobacillus reuteri]OCW62750.1 D-alanyl-D-alanine carboxypeptidase [Limosilactobacillus reuteri]OCW62956.1 D-alanyl-D-alanine carboxypeptidase [Limosilactobacillus reuteri]OCW66912.1 D-alanyl-D-alanine carboxypeptidase [Limosilactobacillus reuteri]OCW68291.1 D-alanyl-D-alanine carboxypeptidase [Limosilactobacillus reuteri]